MKLSVGSRLKILIILIIILEVIILLQPKTETFSSKEVFFQKSEDEQFKIIEKSSQENPVRAWEYLKSLYIKDGQNLSMDDNFFDLSHMFGHIIARDMYRVHGAKALSYCDQTFSHACQHGVAQQALTVKGISGAQELFRECTPENQVYDKCAHGIGHGLITFEALNLNKALAGCDSVFAKENSFHKSSCYDGVFMEYVFSAPKNSVTKENIWNFCRSFPEEIHHHICSYYSINFLQDKGTLSLQESISLCEDAPTPGLLKNCLLGINFGIVHTAKGRIETIKKLCSTYQKKSLENECLFTAATETKYQKYYNWESVVKEFCAILSPISENYEISCIKLTGAN